MQRLFCRARKERREKRNYIEEKLGRRLWGLDTLRGSSGHVTRTMFDKATRSLGTIRVMSNVALIAGSSQQGKALRASVACRKGGKDKE